MQPADDIRAGVWFHYRPCERPITDSDGDPTVPLWVDVPKGLKVHFTTAAEKAEFRKVVQEPVRQFIQEQVGADLVKQIVEAAEAANAATAGQ